MNKILAVTKKELLSFFNSPIAYIFLGTFVLVSYYVFFWVDKFFARNIADLRPLFNWMPLLLIFLVSAITMRMWSEERRMGTLESLMTAPVQIWQLVVGKFLACLSLIVIALLLTISLPITVAILGELDWGPVIGAYLACVLLAAAYVAIGLFVSSKSDNQIVSLILSILLSVVFYFIGAGTFVNLFSPATAEFLKNISTSDHFTAISRGILDFRDIYYYISLAAVFLVLTVLSLQKLRWSSVKSSRHRNIQFFALLLILNLIAANFWLQRQRVKVDLTAGQVHTLSESTEGILSQLGEPLLIRGFISKKTHPLLAPLIPQIKDLLAEYEAESNGMLRAEVVDPKNNAELEEEAGRRYSIRPIPLQISDKYEASLVNAYFDIVVQYGDKFEVLSFKDLIEINVISQNQIDVRLRNLEYDITRTIKKVLYGFQNVDSLFSGLKTPVKLKGYVSAEYNLPGKLKEFKSTAKSVLVDIAAKSNNKFEFEFIEPEAEGGKVAQEIAENYGFRPMMASLFDSNKFYFYFVLVGGDYPIQVSLPEQLDAENFKLGIEAGLKRIAPGFLKSVGLVRPKSSAPQNPYLPQAASGKQFNFLFDQLSKNQTVKNLSLIHI